MQTGPDTLLRRGAIMVIDQAGFTRKVLERGTARALADVWFMRRTLIPVLRGHGGEVYKVDADNLYAFFDTANAAVRGASASHAALRRAQPRRKDPVYASIGIGFGDLFYVTSEDDYYGREVNLAAKLGEDVAEAGETLLTDGAFETVDPGAVEGSASRARYALVSKLRIRYRSWLVP